MPPSPNFSECLHVPIEDGEQIDLRAAKVACGGSSAVRSHDYLSLLDLMFLRYTSCCEQT
jgi:hypothetical protein